MTTGTKDSALKWDYPESESDKIDYFSVLSSGVEVAQVKKEWRAVKLGALLPNAVAGETYMLQVAAVSAAGVSAPNNQVFLTYVDEPPKPVSNPRIE